ncbi:MAG: hypothetical protein OXQ89_14120 [Rhodospirillaceae bacterium]|nr:hypothetical protein [Rhodospirillaceae bacterium]MDD9998874.1 hypothetical protein [Rhodospirillaceae bacterium]
MNTDIEAEQGKTAEAALTRRSRKWPRIAGRTALLAVGLLAIVMGIVYIADTLRGIILEMPSAESGEWASLLGGGLGVWAFFLIRSGLVENMLELAPKVKMVAASVPVPEWSPFFESVLDLFRTLVLPGIVTVFALVFVGEQVREQIVEPAPTSVERQIEELRLAIEPRLENIVGQIENRDLQDALDAQGYTPQRAQQLDLIGGEVQQPDNYFARFPISFEPGSLNDAENAFASGVDYDPEENADLVSRLVNALIHCGVVDDPVILRVEGYASSGPFEITAANLSSDELNVRLANERRRSVKDALDAAILATRLDDAQRMILVIEADDYQTIAEMELDREFNDRPAGEDSNRLPQDFLTRAAHIKVMNPGACRVRSG